MYRVSKTIIKIDGKRKTVYGITSDSITVNDICSDIKSIEHLVNLLNTEDVSPEHLMDIIEDFIISN